MRSLLVVVALGVVAGCSSVNAPPTTCGSDGACPGNLVCAFGSCVDPSDQRLTAIDVEVLDPTGAVPVQSLAVDLRTASRVDVDLKPGVIVTGVVEREGEAEVGVVDATVLARPTEFIDGRAIAPIATTDIDGFFSLTCVEGEDYALTVSSTEALVPPLYVDEPFTADGEFVELDPLQLPVGLFTVTGRVVTRDGVATLPVRALDVRLTKDGRQLSSSALTDADGTFTIALAASELDMQLEITPTAESAANPSFEMIVSVLETSTDLGEIDLGNVLGPQLVEARVLDDAQDPVPGAVAYVSGPLGNGTFNGEFTADDDGIVRMSLPPSESYAVVVVGPATSTGGLLLVEDMVVPAPAQLAWNLPPRVQLRGSVLDPDGNAAANATLSLLRIADPLGDASSTLIDEILGDALVSFEVTTNERGAFAVLVDPGKYRVATRPALGSNLPASSEIVTVPEGGLTQNVVLPQRAFVAGTVLFEGAPVPNAFVRLFSAGFNNERGEAILLGEGLADVEGAFEIVVPIVVTSVANPDPPTP